MIKLSLVLFFLLPGLAQCEEKFIIQSDFGKESKWVEGFLEKSHDVLVRMMDNKKISPPMGIKVTLNKDPNQQGLGGYAAPTEIGFFSNAWPKDKLRIWIMSHELVNLFACHYGGAGGYPSDWWANGRSPFPLYVSCLVMTKLGYKEASDYIRDQYKHKQDHELYWTLYKKYGFQLFSRFFKLVRGDGLDMGLIGPPWPHPDEARTAYTIAYLSMAAKENLAPMIADHCIGAEPDDWKRIHPEISFIPYQVTAEEVDGIIAVREFLFQKKHKGKGVEILRDQYRKGMAFQPLKGKSFLSFVVSSQFGSESDWVEGFLTDLSTALKEITKASFESGKIPINLQKKDVGGIGGGAEGDSMSFMADCWPKENFRLWVLSQELGIIFFDRMAGDFPYDVWGNSSKAFSAFLGALALKKIGYANEAEWVKQMHSGKPEQMVYWKISEQYGEDWIPGIFHLLAKFKDKGNLKKQRLHFIAALSLACKENLYLQFKDMFKDQPISKKEVEKAMKTLGK